MTFTVIQDGGLGADCNYSIAPAASSFLARGGSGTINVAGEDRCAWQAVSNAGWVTVEPGSIGTGDGAVNYTVAANTGPSGRTATISVAGQTFRIKQKKP
jgi:L-aminopeptidase/D-esterase-like protein